MSVNLATRFEPPPPPLFVDVDGTLTRADIAMEALVRFVRSRPWAWLTALFWLLRGPAFVKAMAARRAPVDPARLPYREEVLELIAEAQVDGRRVILASAGHWRNIRRVARHLGLVDVVLATRRGLNLKGSAKLAAIREHVGPDGEFDYVGDSRADACLWRAARLGWSVNHVPPRTAVRRLAAARPGALKAALKAMRPHQWAKNALVLVPAVTSGRYLEPATLLSALGAAVAMSLIASAIYLLNDLLDIESDRTHRTKRRRPLANGDLSIPAALGLSAAAASAGLVAGWLVGGWPLTAWLLAYVAITTAYSLRLKAVMVGDTIVLASLYTIRLWIGAVAIAAPLTSWLLLFSMFLFLSLAYLKRYVEMQEALDPHELLKGRGYMGRDVEVVVNLGVSAGMMSILVLALFAHEPSTAQHYAAPQFLWLLCLPLLYWINRIWMMARRGEVDGDPVVFAIKDRRSRALGVVMVAILLVALHGPAGGAL